MRSASSTCSRRPTARRSGVSFGPCRQDGEASAASRRSDQTSVAVVDVVEVEAGLVEEPGEVDVGADLSQGSQLVDLRLASATGWPPAGCAGRSRRPSRRAACCSRRAGTGTASARLARRRGGCRRAGRGSGGRSGTPCGACPTKSRTVQYALSLRLAQASAELLEEQRRALGRAQHEHGVDVGDVNAFVEQVDGEHGLHVARGEVAQRCFALGSGAVAPHGDRRDAVRR